jgi:hypothetical protein
MPDIKFSFKGRDFDAQVPDSFLQRPKLEQQRLLLKNLQKKYDTKIPERGSDEKGVLDYLALIERPSQALKVGLRESKLGGDIFASLGGVDLTPKEGLFQGMKSGWLGEDEVRTQDALPDNLSPFTKGVLGFAGDVATDPLTYLGPGAVKAAGKLVSSIGEATGATPILKSAGKKVMEAKFGEADIGLPDLARMFNIPVGKSKEAKKTYDASKDYKAVFEKEMADSLGPLGQFFTARQRQEDVPMEELLKVFREEAQRKRMIRKDPKTGKPIEGDAGYYKEDGSLMPLHAISSQARKRLGDEGVEMLHKWEKMGDRLYELSEATGQPMHRVVSKGYFPGVLSKPGREFVEAGKDKFIESFDEFGEPIFRTGYKKERHVLDKKTIDEANAERAEAMGLTIGSHGSRPNPAENLFEFFQTDPRIAMSSRWNRQNVAMQNKWAIDEITDNYRVTGLQSEGGVMAMGGRAGDAFDWSKKGHVKNKETGEYEPNVRAGPTEDGWARRTFKKPDGRVDYDGWKNFIESQPWKEEKQIGFWLKRKLDEGGNQIWVARTANPAKRGDPTNTSIDNYIEEVVDPKTLGYVEVQGIPRRNVPDEVLDSKWSAVYEEQMGLRGYSISDVRAKMQDVGTKKYIKAKAESRNMADQARRIAKEDGSEIFMAPKQIKRQVEDVLSLMRGDIASEKEIKKFFKFYDEIQNGWKAWTLGVRPAYHTRNAVGNILNAYVISGLGVNIPEAIDVFGGAAKLQYYARFNGSDIARQKFISDIGGGKGLFYKGAPKISAAEWNAPNFMDTGFSMKEIAQASRERGITAGHYRKDILRDLEEQQLAAVGKGSKLRRTIGQDNPAVQAGFGLGGTIEGNARYGVFIHTLRQIKKNPRKLSEYEGQLFKTKEVTDPVTGKPVMIRNIADDTDRKFEIASMEVKKSQFDYTDVSKTERDVLKRFMPFYTWTRKNIPAQLKSLVQNPQRAEKLAIAKQQFEHETGDLDYSDYGKFWGDRVPVFLGEESKGVIEAFTLLNVVPMADLQRVLKPAPLLAEMTSPIIKVPLEIVANYDTFRKSKIKKHKGESKDYLGVSLPPRMWHLAQALVPLTEINRLNPRGVFGERMKDEFGRVKSTRAYGGMGALRETSMDAPETARWIRFFSGGTVYDVDLNKNRYIMNKNLKKDIAALKGKIKWAARNGQNDRVKRLYELLDQVMRQEITDPMGQRS